MNKNDEDKKRVKEPICAMSIHPDSLIDIVVKHKIVKISKMPVMFSALHVKVNVHEHR